MGYQPPGMFSWDYWFIWRKDVCHAFHLQASKYLASHDIHGNQHIGHAQSKDLIHWENLGPAVVPVNKTWNDSHIATGSTIREGDKWKMVFTGFGYQEKGVGLVESDDLLQWTSVQNSPVFYLGENAIHQSNWQGQKISWYGLADPFVYPEKIEGKYHVVLNSIVKNEMKHGQGCLSTLTTEDFIHWETGNILTYSGWFDRLETPQLWHHNDIWYLYFGGVLNKNYIATLKLADNKKALLEGNFGNFIFKSNFFHGPFLPDNNSLIELPDQSWGYIHKVIKTPENKNYLLTTASGSKLSDPYLVDYDSDGNLIVMKDSSF